MMFVRAKHGLQVPQHDMSIRYIGTQPVEVEENDYYLRRIAADELEEVQSLIASKPTESVTLKK